MSAESEAILDLLVPHESADLTCDECRHHADDHINAHVIQEPARTFVFENATCWAENICRTCDPALFDRIPEEVIP